MVRRWVGEGFREQRPRVPTVVDDGVLREIGIVREIVAVQPLLFCCRLPNQVLDPLDRVQVPDALDRRANLGLRRGTAESRETHGLLLYLGA